MKIAICFKGAHFTNEPDISWYVDYKNSFEKYIKNIKNSLEENDHEIILFLSTYHSEKENDLMIDYGNNIFWQKYDKNMDTYNAQCIHMLTNVEQVIKYEETNKISFDLLIFTRFDLTINYPINDLFIGKLGNGIVYNKLNVFYNNNGQVDDNFWIIPRSLLEIFKMSLIKIFKNNETSHCIHNFIDTHLLYTNLQDWQKDEPYSLVRNHRTNKLRG